MPAREPYPAWRIPLLCAGIRVRGGQGQHEVWIPKACSVAAFVKVVPPKLRVELQAAVERYITFGDEKAEIHNSIVLEVLRVTGRTWGTAPAAPKLWMTGRLEMSPRELIARIPEIVQRAYDNDKQKQLARCGCPIISHWRAPDGREHTYVVPGRCETLACTRCGPDRLNEDRKAIRQAVAIAHQEWGVAAYAFVTLTLDHERYADHSPATAFGMAFGGHDRSLWRRFMSRMCWGFGGSLRWLRRVEQHVHDSVHFGWPHGHVLIDDPALVEALQGPDADATIKRIQAFAWAAGFGRYGVAGTVNVGVMTSEKVAGEMAKERQLHRPDHKLPAFGPRTRSLSSSMGSKPFFPDEEHAREVEITEESWRRAGVDRSRTETAIRPDDELPAGIVVGERPEKPSTKDGWTLLDRAFVRADLRQLGAALPSDRGGTAWIGKRGGRQVIAGVEIPPLDADSRALVRDRENVFAYRRRTTTAAA